MALSISPGKVIDAVGMGMVLSLAGDLTLYAILPVTAATSGILLTQVGILLSANRFIRLLSNPLTGYLLHHRRRKGFLITGFLLGSFSTLLYQFYQNFWIFLSGRILWGIAFSLIYISAYSIVMDVTSDDHRGRDSGLLQSYYLIGFAVTPFVGAMINNIAGFKVTMLVCALVGLVGALITYLFVPETFVSDAEQKYSEIESSFNEGWFNKLKVILKEFRQFRFIASNIVNGLSFLIGEGLVMSTISYYFLQNYGRAFNIGPFAITAAAAGGTVLTIRATVSAIIAPMAGHASDKLTNRWQMILVGIIAGIIGLGIINLTQNPSIFIIGIIIFALNGAIIPAVVPAILTDRSEKSKIPLKMGILATTADIGMAVAPAAGYAYLVEHDISSLYFWGIGISGISLLVGLIAARLEKRTQQKPAL